MNKKIFISEFDSKYRVGAQKVTAFQFVDDSLDDIEHGLGELERLRAKVEKTAKTLSRLVDVLYNDGVISISDVYTIAGETNPNMNEDL